MRLIDGADAISRPGTLNNVLSPETNPRKHCDRELFCARRVAIFSKTIRSQRSCRGDCPRCGRKRPCSCAVKLPELKGNVEKLRWELAEFDTLVRHR